MTRSLAIALLILLVGALGGGGGCKSGCGGRDAPPVVPADPDGSAGAVAAAEVAGPTVDVEAVAAAWRKVEKEVAAVETMARNADAYQEVLAKHARNFRGRRILERIPLDPDPEGLRAQLEAHARRFGLKVDGFRFEPRNEKAPRPLPRRFDGPGPFPFEPGDVVVEAEIRFRLLPLDADATERFVRTLADGVGRMVCPTEVALQPGGARVRAGAHHFRRMAPPAERFVAPSLSRIFSAAGLPPQGPDCGSSGRCRDLLGRIEKRFDAVAPLRPKAELALVVLGEAHLWEVREERFNALAATCNAIRYSDLLK